ncbi:MAG: vitamin B12-dependent ribonucleotide reductase, partial [Bdellovibrionales bacterium]|nr:vitamin B12-dependent ribonucleotide reductase [Bdellovibrionales bacterium]
MAAHAATGLAEAQGKSIDQVGELLKFKDQSSGDPSNLFRYFFSEPKSHPFHLVAWKKRDCRISSGDNKVVFEQLGAEFPQAWSQMACNIVASKYLHGELKSPERESGLKDLLSRVTESIVDWAKKDGSLSSAADERCFQHELSHILLHQYAAFNSPVWFNVGVRPNPQCSACFILAVDDTMDALLDLQALEGRLFKYGSGTGTNLSTLRSTKERLSGGGTPSGPVSFMRAFDAWAGIIKSGGKTRRAAKMQILNVDHPDIVDFVECKTKEEKKAWALIEQGYDGSFSAQDGAYQAVAFQNANLSVRADDTFMEAARDRKTYWTHRVADGSPCEELDARKMLEKIAAGTHLCGDPGMQFDTIINKWHTCPNSGRINASNPCSEYMHLDNSACNLASINLLRYLDEQCNFNIEAICHTIRQLITAQDALIDHASYPSDKIEKCARDFRQLGLGYANLGALLMSLGFAYDSDGGREWAAVLTALMTGEAYRCSALLAKKIGPFKGFSANRSEMLKVLEMHYQELRKINPQYVSPELYQSACRSWEEAIKFGTEFGFRNSQTTVLAPTGTISFMMDCDTTGIEPDISLVKYKRLADGGLLKIANRTVARALDRLGYRQEARNEILKWIETHDTIEGCQTLQPEHLEIFDCALRPANGVRYISHMGHLRMMA